MKLSITLLLSMAAITLLGQESGIIADNAEIKKEGSGYAFTEGPAVSRDGKIFFTDQPNNRIYVWDETGAVALWSEDTGRSNGMDFDADGKLVACADLHNQIVYFDSDKKMQPLLENYDGKHLNGPNDIWIAPNGDIYFTDPFYRRNYWQQGHTEVQDVQGVYLLSRNGNITRVIDDLRQPNGIIGTPDGKTLYVADIRDRKIWKYEILPNGSLTHKTFFAPEGSDGMTIDNRGNIYLSMGKVWVYSPDGILIQEIEVPESPSNVCFGGKERDILFITARTSVYTLKMNVKGVK